MISTGLLDIDIAGKILGFGPDTTRLSGQINEAYIQCLSEKYDGLVEALMQADSAKTEALEVRMGRLTEPQKNRFICYPRVAGILKNIQENHIDEAAKRLLYKLDGELAVLFNEFDTQNYGSIHSPTYSHIVTFKPEEGIFKTMPLFNLDLGPSLDFFSKDIFRPGNELALFSYAEASEIQEGFNEYLAPLANSEAMRYVQAFTDTVTLRKIVDGNKKHVSSTFTSLSRQVHLLFRNLDLLNGAELADILVHESTHTMLDQLEEVSPWAPPFNEHSENMIRSPWSGNHINLGGGLLQAIFVWYALFNFWQEHLRRSGPYESYGQQRLEFICKGFRGLDLEGLLDENPLEISETLKELYLKIQDTVINT